ncbi:MAG: ABC transporter ATP-binding protein [Ectothiorhodospiraceae bacterium]|nr:ABC transporter ATP-binding protein [Ectothiorhodospiraceae bacterium]
MSTLVATGVVARLGPRTVLHGVDARVAPGELLGVIGPNAAGKSTLLRVLAGLLPPGAGTVTLDGRPLADWSPRERARRIAWLGQERECHWPIAVREVVALGRLAHHRGLGGSGPEDHPAVERALARAGLEQLADRPASELSGGERARVMLARALAVGAPALLADEPTAGLDPAHQLEVMALLRTLADEGVAVAVVVHDLTLAARHCTGLVLMHAGRVIAAGRPREVLTEASLRAGFRIRARLGETAEGPYVVPLEAITPSAGDGAAS